MTHVSVLGTGAMGSALVEALAGTGAQVTVWNRTRKKAEAVSRPRVRLADSVAEALRSSPLAVLSVSDQELARTLVEEAGEDLTAKVVASTSFVTPDQARVFQAAVVAAGGRYLDLSIPAYPSEVRARAGVFLVSGHRAGYEAHRERFERIGRVSFVDDAPGAAYISEMAVLLAYLPMAVGLLQGLRICEQHDIPARWFNEMVPEYYSFHIRSLLTRVAEQPDPATRNVEASISEWGKSAVEYGDYLRERGLDSGMYEALHRLFTAASDAGRGDADWTGVVEYAAMR